MKKIISIGVKTLFAFSATFSAYADIKLTNNGNVYMPIVIPDNPTKVEEYSANELKEHLDKMSGVDFPIIKFSASDYVKRAIYVGDSPKARELLNNLDPKKLDFDTTIIKTSGENLVLLGHPKRGTLFSVISFLEDELGVRWWTSTESFIPQKSTITVKEQDTRYTPALKHRRLDYYEWKTDKFPARLRAGDLVFPDKKLQRQTNNIDAIGYHSFYRVLSPKKYFDSHPEWFSMNSKGKRYHKKGEQLAQLCLTNEEMTKEFTKNVLERIRKTPHATFAHISQNDYYNYCECKKCTDFVNAHGKEQSALMVHFVNKVAEEVEKEFPNIKVVTFAYQYTRHAPQNIKPRHNVWIELCSIECDFAHPLETDTDYGFTKDIQDWSKLTKNLTIWNYVTNYNNLMYPFPNLHCIGQDINFFVKNNAVGLFEQADNYCSIGDFVRLRHWVMAHLMWNPSLDTKKLVREFLYGYYTEEVGKYLEEYLWTLNDRAYNLKYFQGCYVVDWLLWMDIDTFIKASKAMEKAFDTAIELEKKDPKKYAGLTFKLRRDRTSYDWFVLMNYADLQLMAEKQGKSLSHLRPIEYTASKIAKTLKDHKVKGSTPPTYPEDCPKVYSAHITHALKNQLKYLKNAKREFPSKDLIGQYKEGTFVEIQNERFVQAVWRDTRVPCEYVADKHASDGFASVKYSYNQKVMKVPFRFDLLNLKSKSGNTKDGRKWQIWGYVSTKGKTASVKTNYSKWKEIKTGDEYQRIDFGTISMTNEELTRKNASKLLHIYYKKEKALVDRIVVEEL